MEEDQSTCEAATQGELALKQEQVQASTILCILSLERYRRADEKRSDQNQKDLYVEQTLKVYPDIKEKQAKSMCYVCSCV